MKSHITVIINETSISLERSLDEALEKYKLDWDSIDSTYTHSWDYWYFPSENYFDDPEVLNMYSSEPKEILQNSTYLKNLPKGYTTSGVITLNNGWVDLQDFGWKMIEHPSKENDEAEVKWKNKLDRLINENKNKICIQVITHN